MKITHASMQDLAAVAAVEAMCFPPAEAATEKDFAGRIQHYGNHFWLMFDGDRLIAFVDALNFRKIPMADQSFGNFLNLFESKQLQTKMPVFNTSR